MTVSEQPFKLEQNDVDFGCFNCCIYDSINPITATIILIVKALIWEISGMVLCNPLTEMLKVVRDHVDSLKPYGFLIGEEARYEQQKMNRNRSKSV